MTRRTFLQLLAGLPGLAFLSTASAVEPGQVWGPAMWVNKRTGGIVRMTPTSDTEMTMTPMRDEVLNMIDKRHSEAWDLTHDKDGNYKSPLSDFGSFHNIIEEQHERGLLRWFYKLKPPSPRKIAPSPGGAP